MLVTKLGANQITWADHSWHANCLAWCGENYSLPPTVEYLQFSQREFETKALSVIDHFETGSADRNNIPIIISSGLIYNVNLTEEVFKNCSNGGCHLIKTLEWQGRGTCNLTLTCPVLSPEGCSTFGVVLKNQRTVQQTCFPHQSVTIALPSSSQVTLEAWAVEKQRFNVTCNMWCGKISDKIERKNEQNVNQVITDQLDKLYKVRALTQFFCFLFVQNY